MTNAAPTFRTITDADWARELRRARELGRADGESMLAQIRAAVARDELSANRAPSVSKANERGGVACENHAATFQIRPGCDVSAEQVRASFKG